MPSSSLCSHLSIAFISTSKTKRLHHCFVIGMMASFDFFNRGEVGTLDLHCISWKGGVIQRTGVRLGLQFWTPQSPYPFVALSNFITLFFLRSVFVSHWSNRGWRIVFQIYRVGLGMTDFGKFCFRFRELELEFFGTDGRFFYRPCGHGRCAGCEGYKQGFARGEAPTKA